jgi:hypothetical protein
MSLLGGLIESRNHFFRRYRTEATTRQFLVNEAHMIELISAASLTTMLTRLVVPPLMEPVVVAPSADQMAAAFQPVVRPEGACPICQEQFQDNSVVVRLRNCQHCFHRACASVWYSRSVYCPLCRNDIRT